MKVLQITFIGLKVNVLVIQSCLTLQLCGLCSARLLFPWNFPGENIRGGCHFLLEEIFPTQELNLVSHIPGILFTVWATKEALGLFDSE